VAEADSVVQTHQHVFRYDGAALLCICGVVVCVWLVCVVGGRVTSWGEFWGRWRGGLDMIKFVECLVGLSRCALLKAHRWMMLFECR